MTVSFLILNYKSYPDTIRVTNEILEFSVSQFEYNIVIVDNKSPNDSFRVLRTTFLNNDKVSVIEAGSNAGYSKGNNLGLRYLQDKRPDYVCIMNNDVHFDADVIARMIELDGYIIDAAFFSPIQMLPNGEVAAFGSLRQPTFQDDIKSYLPILFTRNKKWNYFRSNKYNVQEVDIVPGALLFIRYSKFERMGFFDESTFLFCEERFTSQRVKELGMKNYIVLDKTYIHEHSKTINAETSALLQLKFLHNGKIAFTKKYRKNAEVKVFILNILYHLKRIELKTIIAFRRSRKK